MANITEELKQHIIENEHIQEIHFDATGNHYFHTYDLAGKKYSRVISDLNGVLTDEQASQSFLIMETLTRAQILGESEPEEIQEPIEGKNIEPIE